MIRYSVIFSVFIITIVTMSPAGIFAYLKYNGLEDISYDDDEGEYTPESSPVCILHVSFGQYEHSIETPSEICGVIICRGPACAFEAKIRSDFVSVAQSNEVRSEAKNELKKILDAQEGVAQEDVIGPEPDDVQVQGIYDYPLWQWLSIFSVAISFCVLGTFSSIASRSRSNPIEGSRQGFYGVSSIYMIACLTGVLVVSLFASGLVQGHLFPNFSGDILNFGFNSWSALKFRGQDWFKLAIWAYIAGFNERFVPNLLERLVQRSQDLDTDQKATAPDTKEATTG